MRPLSSNPALPAPPCVAAQGTSVVAIRTDEERWFKDQVSPHESALRAFLGHRFPSLGDLEDIVQESYIRVLRARARGNQMSNVKSLLFTTAHNLAINRCQHQKVIPFESLDGIEHLAVQEVQPHAAEAASRSEEVALLRDAIAGLPPRCREILRLRRLHGLSYQEIADRLGISERTVNVQLAIALERLREFFLARGIARRDPPVT